MDGDRGREKSISIRFAALFPSRLVSSAPHFQRLDWLTLPNFLSRSIDDPSDQRASRREIPRVTSLLLYHCVSKQLWRVRSSFSSLHRTIPHRLLALAIFPSSSPSSPPHLHLPLLDSLRSLCSSGPNSQAYLTEASASPCVVFFSHDLNTGSSRRRMTSKHYFLSRSALLFPLARLKIVSSSLTVHV